MLEWFQNISIGERITIWIWNFITKVYVNNPNNLSNVIDNEIPSDDFDFTQHTIWHAMIVVSSRCIAIINSPSIHNWHSTVHPQNKLFLVFSDPHNGPCRCVALCAVSQWYEMSCLVNKNI